MNELKRLQDEVNTWQILADDKTLCSRFKSRVADVKLAEAKKSLEAVR